MRVAILSDIHANIEAFQTSLNYLKSQAIDRFIFLGDYVGEHANPQKTMECLYQLMENVPVDCIAGNKEGYWLNAQKNQADCAWKEYDSTTGCMYYTYHRLTEKDLQFYDSLPIYKVIQYDGYKPFTITHGSPRKSNERLNVDNPDFALLMEQYIHTGLTFCGHTHTRFIHTYQDKMVYDVGAIGVPHNSNGDTQFAIIENDATDPFGWHVEPITLSYNKEKTLQALRDENMYAYAPYWTRITENLVRDGKVMHATVLFRAMDICKEKYGACNWPEIPDDCWELAYQEFFSKM